MYLQLNRSGKQGIISKLFHGHGADWKPVARGVQVCSCVITHLCAYEAECCLIQPFFPSCDSEGLLLSLTHTSFLSLLCVRVTLKTQLMWLAMYKEGSTNTAY